MNQIDYDIDDFMDYCKAQQLRPKTIFSYEQTLRIFERYMLDVFNITSAADTKEVHIREYIKYLETRGKYTIVVDEKTRDTNNPQNRTDIGKPIS